MGGRDGDGGRENRVLPAVFLETRGIVLCALVERYPTKHGIRARSVREMARNVPKECAWQAIAIVG